MHLHKNIQPLYITEKGHGEHAALFLHGLWGGGNYLRRFDLLEPSQYTQYFPDELGFGKSPKPYTEYNLKTHVEHILYTVPKRKYTVVGHSFGTLLALYFAAKYPHLVNTLILISPLIYSSPDHAKHYLSTALIPRLTIQKPNIARAMCIGLCRTNLLTYTFPLLIPKSRRLYLQNCTEHTWHSYYSSFTKCILKSPMHLSLEKVVRSIPTLLLYGLRDRYADLSLLEGVRGKEVTRVPVEFATHYLLFEYASVCKEVIQGYLR